jgi:hypothetical protein
MKNIKSAHEDIEVILKRIKSIDFCSPIGCAPKSQEYMGRLKYNQHNMSVDLRNDFAVCSNNSSKDK